ncbi:MULTISPECIES: DUF397 domain-containing protein [Streptomycetaceae]|uniref:DUF397 domain-containing protein n=1 Tax=Streptantibioticus cattleyicolor (strain ATCC 35852 / DSM 46488 / JCM 4925 / NBRC 14057 / NRRL 8057) TaxID=1003195 RepID=F8JSH6_STREN|nr:MULTISPECIES: DUF397 domain-containing protein [Streptomycetaceae]AEW96700.1 hypothetical protein SCATT_43290 [Streptantibioticus cattleyicolor NRRL 8057 = DSM 46488]MYS61189.1 DUF397 domain-containing protein [Streptomyces sp. SID5468]CCB77038.1 conserved protein of unknown function [Streptantibioticus cattleyicolor NRRL 8057 = DSM 46488]
MTTFDWQTSSYCEEASNCLGISAPRPEAVLLRESDAPDTVLTTTPAALGAFLRAVKAGRFDARDTDA